jgi:hypothetical protein
MHSTDDAVTHPKKVGSGLSVLKLYKPVHCGEETTKELLLDKLRHKGVTAKWNTKHLNLGVRNQLDLIRLRHPIDLDRTG